MSYTNCDLVRELEDATSHGYDVAAIARTAFSIYHLHGRDLSSEMDRMLLTLMAMEEGEEFELSESEFRLMLESLRAA